MTLTFIFLVFYLSILSYRDLTAERRRNLSFSNINNNENNEENNNSSTNDNEKVDNKTTETNVENKEDKKD